jgi:hypothetical protein
MEMNETVDNLNGIYLGVVSLVCLLTYLAVNLKPIARKSSARRFTAMLRSSVGAVLKHVQPHRSHVRTS